MTNKTLIDGLLSKGETEKVLDFLQILISEGNTLINELCKDGAIDKALDFSHYMISKLSIYIRF